MIFSSNPLFNTLKIYIIIIILLVYLKPDFIYDKKTKKFRQFGTDKGNTIFSLPVLSILLAVVLYLLFLSINKLTNTNQENSNNNNLNNQLLNQQLLNQQITQQINQQLNQQLSQQLNQHLLQQLNFTNPISQINPINTIK